MSIQSGKDDKGKATKPHEIYLMNFKTKWTSREREGSERKESSCSALQHCQTSEQAHCQIFQDNKNSYNNKNITFEANQIYVDLISLHPLLIPLQLLNGTVNNDQGDVGLHNIRIKQKFYTGQELLFFHCAYWKQIALV